MKPRADLSSVLGDDTSFSNVEKIATKHDVKQLFVILKSWFYQANAAVDFAPYIR